MSEANQTDPSPTVRLAKLARSRKYEDLEAAWMAALESDALPMADMLEALRVLAKREQSDLLESLLWYLLTAVRDRDGASGALAVLRDAAASLPESDVLRDEAAAFCRESAASTPSMRELAAATVRCEGMSLPVAVETVGRLLALCPGDYVLDEKSRNPGRVEGVDDAGKALRVSFADGEKRCEPSILARLQRLDADDFRALNVFERKRLDQMALEAPEALVRLVLQSFQGRLPFKHLKAHLADVIGGAGWGKWWRDARAQIRLSSVIQMSDGTQPELVLRRQAVTYESQVQSRMRAAASLREKCTIALECLDLPEFAAGAATAGKLDRGRGPDPALLTFLSAELKTAMDAGGAEPPGPLGALVLVEEISRRQSVDDPDVTEKLRGLVSDGVRFPELLGLIPDDALTTRVLAFVRRVFPARWPEFYAAVMPTCRMTICDAIARALSDEEPGERLAGAVDRVLARPGRCAGALVWLWRACGSGRFSAALPEMDRVSVLLRLLSAADTVKRNTVSSPSEEQKRLLSDLRNALSLKNYALTKDVTEHADSDQAREILTAVKRDLALSEYARETLLHILGDKHPELFAEQQAPLWEEDVNYTTGEGLSKQRKAFEEIANVKIPANARAIGDAAAKGDLSENAEFTAALEERDRLMERAGRMQSELAKARVIPSDLASADSVTIGSAVKARNLGSAETETFLFLGPWDTDSENGILSYRSPLGLAFMGKKVGDEVTLTMGAGERRWEILEIS